MEDGLMSSTQLIIYWIVICLCVIAVLVSIKYPKL